MLVGGPAATAARWVLRVRGPGLVALLLAVASSLVSLSPAPAGAATPPTSVITTGLTYPGALAVDGAGHVFTTSNGTVVRVNADGTGQVTIATDLGTTGGMALDGLGHLYVALGGSVRKMNLDGSGQSSLASGSLSSPRAIAISSAGQLFVVDWGHQRVVRMGLDGSGVTVVGSGFTQLSDSPQALVLDDAGHYFVSDNGNLRVWEYNVDGTGGTVVLLLSEPMGLALAASGRLYAASPAGGVRAGDPGGSGYLANQVWVGGSFSAPTAVAVDGAGHVFVADGANPTTIYQMDADGSNKVSLGSSFIQARQLVLDGYGHLFVLDNGNSRVQVINLGSTSPPGAPTNVSAAARSGQALVSWNAPASNGGAPVSSYTATASPGGATCTSATPSCTVAGLSDGRAYSFTVTALNAAGQSSPSAASAAVTYVIPPGAPTAVAASTGPGLAVVSWTAPTSDGGSVVTSYTATASPGGRSCTTSDGGQLSCSVTGLSGGTAYTFTVTATNSAGSGTSSLASSSVTPPVAVGNVVASPARSSLLVSWTPPVGVSPIYYTASVPSGQRCIYTVRSPETDACTINGLSNGTSYTVTLVATLANGSTITATPAAPATPRTVPGIICSATTKVGSSSLEVAWSPPDSDGGSPISSYRVKATPGGATCTYLVPGSGPSANTCSIGGLVAGRRYQVTVAAGNAAGYASAGCPSSPAVPVGNPTEPTAVVAASGASSVVASWKAPASNGGSAITSYTAIASPGGATCTYLVPGSGPSANTCTIANLSPGTSYRVAVVATTALGTSPPSASSNAASAARPPSPPQNVVAVAGSSSIKVSWTPPLVDGFAPVSSYTATAYPGQASCTYTVPASGPELDACTIGQLQGGTSYTVSVAASNVAGPGTASPGASATPYTAPAAPAAPSAIMFAAGSATVTWSAPSFDGGSTITSYVATAVPGGATCSTDGSATGCNIGNLSPGSYRFTVAAGNAGGLGPASPASELVSIDGPPAAPASVTLTPGYGSIGAAWTAPPANGTSEVSSYRVCAYEADALIGSCKTVSTRSTSFTVAPGARVAVTVEAKNAVAYGPIRDASATAWQLPGAPTKVTAVPAPRGVTVSWTPPADSGGTPVVSYTATYYAVNGDLKGTSCTYAVPASGPEADTCTISGLGDSWYLYVKVVATSAAGTSADSAASAPTHTMGPPGNVNAASVAATAAPSAAIVTWSPVEFDGYGTVTGYTAVATPGGKTCTTTGATTCTIKGLTNGTAYRVNVYATNAAGSGSPAGNAPVTPAPGKPSAPTAVIATPGKDSVVSVSWTAGPNGDSAITGYTATATPGGKTCTTTGATTCTITGLSLGTPYTVAVTEANKFGSSPASSPSAPATPYTFAGAVTGASASSAVGGGTVSWSAPASDGYSAITGYVVQLYVGTTKATSCTTTTETTCSFTGLTTGTRYAVSVGATNAAGTTLSSISSTITPYTTPGAAKSLTGTGGNASLTLSWAAPASDGYSPITGYTATLSNGKTCTTNGETTCTITGLSNGTSYTYSVVATNAAGPGPASATSAGISPRAVAPSGLFFYRVQAVSGGIYAVLGVGNDGGATVTSYTVTASPGGRTCTVDNGTNVCTVSGLTGGVSYTLSFTATNSVGTSSASPASDAVVPRSAPAAPGTATLLRGNASATATWAASAFDGGSAITGYTATASPGGASCTTPSSTFSCTISGLSPGTSYTVSVTATNAIGTSSPSAASAPVVAATNPGRPTSLSSTLLGPSGSSASGTMYLSWTAPASSGGVAISSYTATATLPYGQVPSFTCSATTSTSCTMTGLTDGQWYTFAVTATNAAGFSSAASDTIYKAAATPTGPVTGLTTASSTSVSGTTMLVNFSQPTVTGTYTSGIGTITYRVTASPGGATCTVARFDLSLSPSGCLVSGLTPGTAYTFSVVVDNGYGARSVAATTTGTPIGRPEPPTAITTTSATGQLSVSWTAPAATGGSAIAAYTAYLFSVPSGSLVDSCLASGGATSCTVSGLSNLATYDVYVKATNSSLTSLASGTVRGLVAPAGFSISVTSSTTQRQGGVFTAYVAGAAAGAVVNATFAGGARGSCTASDQGWCQVTSSATTSASTAAATATYTAGGSTKTTTNGAMTEAPVATCKLPDAWVSASAMMTCTIAGKAAGSKTTYQLALSSDGTEKSWPSNGVFDVSDLDKFGASQYRTGSFAAYVNDVLVGSYTITCESKLPLFLPPYYYSVTAS